MDEAKAFTDLADSMITFRGTVYPWQCDHMGHMNVMWYAGRFDEATWQLLGMIGLTSTYMQVNQRRMVAVQQNTSFMRELLAGSLIIIRSEILEMREEVINFSHQMIDLESNETAAKSILSGVHLSVE